MADAEIHRDGGCRCGAVRFRATGKPLWVAHCHCTDCRRSSGGIVTTWVGYRDQVVTFENDDAASYTSSPGVERQFCGQCGTPLTFVADVFPGELHLMVGAFDDPEDLVPQVHVWTSEKVSWFTADTHLPMKPRHGATPRDRN